jgi:hypothetical protein
MGHVVIMKNILQKFGYSLGHAINILMARIKGLVKVFVYYSYDQTEVFVNIIILPNL